MRAKVSRMQINMGITHYITARITFPAQDEWSGSETGKYFHQVLEKADLLLRCQPQRAKEIQKDVQNPSPLRFHLRLKADLVGQ